MYLHIHTNYGLFNYIVIILSLLIIQKRPRKITDTGKQVNWQSLLLTIQSVLSSFTNFLFLSVCLTHSGLARLAEGVIRESLHKAGLSHSAGADDDHLQFIISDSRRHLSAALRRSHSGRATTGPPLDSEPRLHPALTASPHLSHGQSDLNTPAHHGGKLY